jgi:nickel-dependent lactate racemase
MKYDIPYGREYLSIDLPDENVTICCASNVRASLPGNAIVRKALDNPIGSRPLYELAQNKKSACIVVNDVTRPTPSRIILEEILLELSKAGIKDEQVKILIANGNHRPTKREELIEMLGEEIVKRYPIVNHVATRDEDLTYLGDTPLGVPIHVNSALAKSELKILTGTIRPHQSAGYSGGRKSVLPGVAGLKSIMKHHSFPIFPLTPQLGVIEGNSFHEEALYGAKLVGIDFILNVIENAHKEIIDAVAGDLELAHAEGVRKSSALWTYILPEQADIVITSPGGYPKDINLHQSQKALAPCELALKKGGVIILVAQCADGSGAVPEWFEGAESPEDVIDRFIKNGWSPKAHAKPFLLARPLSNFKVIAVCEGIDRETLEKMFMIPAATLEEAYKKALDLCDTENPKILILPCAGDVIPMIKK